MNINYRLDTHVVDHVPVVVVPDNLACLLGLASAISSGSIDFHSSKFWSLSAEWMFAASICSLNATSFCACTDVPRGISSSANILSAANVPAEFLIDIRFANSWVIVPLDTNAAAVHGSPSAR